MAKIYDLAVKTGTYQKDGQTKNRYLNIGCINEGKEGPYLFLDATFNPAGIDRREGSSSIIVSMFKPKQGGQQQQQQQPGGGFDSDIPFASLNNQIKNHLV